MFLSSALALKMKTMNHERWPEVYPVSAILLVNIIFKSATLLSFTERAKGLELA